MKMGLKHNMCNCASHCAESARSRVPKSGKKVETERREERQKTNKRKTERGDRRPVNKRQKEETERRDRKEETEDL